MTTSTLEVPTTEQKVTLAHSIELLLGQAPSLGLTQFSVVREMSVENDGAFVDLRSSLMRLEQRARVSSVKVTHVRRGPFGYKVRVIVICATNS